jgi:glycosyltransferase involved in cell wall biosynthesis
VDAAFEADSRRLATRRTELREQWGFSADQIVFLYAGKFLANKRPLDFVRAIQQAGAGNSRVAGLMVGDGPLRRECEDMVRRSGASIRFAGFLNQSEIVRAYVAGDALVLASEAETWGIVVNEAMTCGRPVLISDRVGCGPDLVRTGETGFVFPLGDVNALSARMIECASSPDRLAAMGDIARARMHDHSISVAVDGVTAALARIRGR